MSVICGVFPSGWTMGVCVCVYISGYGTAPFRPTLPLLSTGGEGKRGREEGGGVDYPWVVFYMPQVSRLSTTPCCLPRQIAVASHHLLPCTAACTLRYVPYSIQDMGRHTRRPRPLPLPLRLRLGLRLGLGLGLRRGTLSLDCVHLWHPEMVHTQKGRRSLLSTSGSSAP